MAVKGAPRSGKCEWCRQRERACPGKILLAMGAGGVGGLLSSYPQPILIDIAV